MSKADVRSEVDRTVVFDTVHQVVMETLWREPDTLGRVYPRVTVRKEMGSSRETRKDVERVRKDTVYVWQASKSSAESDIRAPTSTATWVPWVVMIVVIVVIAVVVVVILIKRV